MISYEYPLNERIRTLLRLEDLFDKAAFFVASDAPESHHMALVNLFEILEVAGRADLKFDLMQELERQRQILLAFRNNPDISEDALAGALYEIEQSAAALLSMQGRIGHYLRENEWLMAIKNRVHIPGGVCEFDLPSYHYWLNQDAQSRRASLDGWMTPLLPIHQALVIVLRLLRSSGRPEGQVARRGAYQMMMTGRVVQLVRLRLAHSAPFVPEISASKYALNIRFLAPDMDQRPKQVEADVQFDLTFCNL
ncbi:MAG TPA: cell division protein ZapD [Rhodocyclaceae bacterium]|nr:cell division protein ZapD [Rhodocyclaceae bacterium]